MSCCSFAQSRKGLLYDPFRATVSLDSPRLIGYLILSLNLVRFVTSCWRKTCFSVEGLMSVLPPFMLRWGSILSYGLFFLLIWGLRPRGASLFGFLYFVCVFHAFQRCHQSELEQRAWQVGSFLEGTALCISLLNEAFCWCLWPEAPPENHL